MSDKKEVRISVRLTGDQAAKLERWAEAFRTTKSAYIRDWMIEDLPDAPPKVIPEIKNKSNEKSKRNSQ